MIRKMRLFLLAAALPIAAAASEADPYAFAIQGGLLLPGTVGVWNDYAAAEPETGPGLVLKVSGDKYLAAKLSAGLYGQYVSAGASLSAAEAGVAVKGRLLLAPGKVLRPGIAAGYRHGEIGRVSGPADGIALNGFLEYLHEISPAYLLSFETGFAAQPAGGNGEYNVSWAPIFYFLAGLCLERR